MTQLLTYKRLNKHSILKLPFALVMGAASAYVPLASAAPIYKVVDEDTGQVTFTDRPQSYEQQSDKRVIQTNVSTASEGAQSNSTSGTDNNSQSVVAAAVENSAQSSSMDSVNYQMVMIEPSEARAYHRPAQVINVAVQTRPALQAGDSVSIYFDGNEIARGLSTSIATVNVLPGQHSIQAVIKDKNGQVLQQVGRTVQVIQNTRARLNRQRATDQLQAYQNLPWHKKILLKMRQNPQVQP